MSIILLDPEVLLINHTAFYTILVVFITVGVVLPQIVLISVRNHPASFVEYMYPHPHLLGIVVAISAQ